jgi:hypothetical protein
MKAVLKDTLYGRMLKEIDDAKRNNKEVDYFLITREEENELYRMGKLDSIWATFNPNVNYHEETIRTIELEDRSAKYLGHRYVRFAQSPHKFMDIDIFVVPREFCK